MSSTLNLDPKNLMMFAVLGIGAYWLVTRQARASTLTPKIGAAQTPRPSSSNNLLNGLFNGLNTYLKGGATGTVYNAAAIQNDDLPGQPGFGWQYFTDGTAISPEGVYYFQGQEVWSPDMSASNPVGATGSW